MCDIRGQQEPWKKLLLPSRRFGRHHPGAALARLGLYIHGLHLCHRSRTQTWNTEVEIPTGSKMRANSVCQRTGPIPPVEISLIGGTGGCMLGGSEDDLCRPIASKEPGFQLPDAGDWPIPPRPDNWTERERNRRVIKPQLCPHYKSGCFHLAVIGRDS